MDSNYYLSKDVEGLLEMRKDVENAIRKLRRKEVILSPFLFSSICHLIVEKKLKQASFILSKQTIDLRL